jgi:hypothetical protein
MHVYDQAQAPVALYHVKHSSFLLPLRRREWTVVRDDFRIPKSTQQTQSVSVWRTTLPNSSFPSLWTGESRQLRKSIRLITYNVWFEAIRKEQRGLELLRHLCEQNPDVCCLQEVTRAFETILRNHPFAKRHWVLISLGDQQDKTHSTHGTIIFSNKALLKDGWMAHASYAHFPETKMMRCLLLLELSSVERGTTVRTLSTLLVTSTLSNLFSFASGTYISITHPPFEHPKLIAVYSISVAKHLSPFYAATPT